MNLKLFFCTCLIISSIAYFVNAQQPDENLGMGLVELSMENIERAIDYFKLSNSMEQYLSYPYRFAFILLLKFESTSDVFALFISILKL